MRLSVRELMPDGAWRWRERSWSVDHTRGGGWRGGECGEARGGSISNPGAHDHHQRAAAGALQRWALFARWREASGIELQ
ncbi:MAG: hypothetical protein CVV16_12380, partial [Gammaproteobacteria bacterium HGW-Gammaproteobacteria-6]